MKHAVLVVALAACGGASKPTPTPPPAAIPAAPAAEEPRDGVPVVLDAGAAPRYALRYHPSVGDRRELTMEIAFSFEVGGTPYFLPTMIMSAMHEIVAVADDGTISARMTFGRSIAQGTPHHTAEQVAAVQANLDRLDGVAMIDRYTALGELVDSQIDEDVPEDLRASFDDVTSGIAPLPSTPVGRGARWRTHVERSKQGLPLGLDIVSEVLDVDADHVRIRATITAAGGSLGARQRISGTGASESWFDLGTMAFEGWMNLDLEVDDRGTVTTVHTMITFGMK